MKRWSGLLFFLGVAFFARAEEDAVSSEERSALDVDEPERESGPNFSGDVRIRLREVLPPSSSSESAPPSFRHSVYVYERTRLAWGPVGAGYLLKRPSPGPALSLENLRDHGTLKASIHWGETSSACRMVGGDYTLAFGQGLLFYDGFGEYVRPVLVKDRGPRPDNTSGPQDSLRGAAGRSQIGAVGVDLFVSEKSLTFPLNAEGSVNASLDGWHEASADMASPAALENTKSVTERLAGGRLAWRFGAGEIGVSGYGSRYSRLFAPEQREGAGARFFRGDGLTMMGADVRGAINEWRFVGEVAQSRVSGPGSLGRGGIGWTGTALGGPPASRLWLSVFHYDPDFHSPHGKGLAFGVSGDPDSLPNNQSGFVGGAEWTRGRWSGRANATVARFPQSKGNGRDRDPLAPSQGHYFLMDQRWKVLEDVELRCVLQERGEDKNFEDPISGLQRQVEEKVQKGRGSLSWAPTSQLRWTIRHDVREERVSAFGKKSSGRMWVADVLLEPRPKTRIKARAYFFRSPEAYLTTGPEEIWDGVVYDRLAGNGGNLRGRAGTRLFLIFGQQWGAVRLWGKYEITNRPAQSEERAPSPGAPRRAWHLQTEVSWGAR